MVKEGDLKIEAFDYVQLAFEKFHNHQVNGCIKLNGQVNVKIFKRAVNLTINDLPQLACKLIKGEYKKAKDELEVTLVTSDSVGAEVDKIMAKSISLKEEQQVIINIIRVEKKDTIVVVMSHLLCDGISIKRYLYLICKYYNQLIQSEKIIHYYRGKKRDIRWIKDFNLKDIKSRIKPKKEQLQFLDGDNNLFAKCRIDKKYYKTMQSYIKKHKVTMNDLLMAVYYKTVIEVFDYPLKSICCAMDLRRYIEDKDSYGLCNQTGNGFTTIDKAESMEFEELLQEVHKQMKYEKEKGICLKQVKVLEKAFRILPHKVSRRLIRLCISNPQVALTNIGKIEKEKVTFGDLETLDCYLLPSLKRAPNFQMAVSTFDECIMLAVNMIVNEEGKEKIEEYLKRYSEVLKNIISC